MASYLLQVGYTPEAWSAMIQNPQDRSAAIKAPVEKLGGRVERFWLSFGDYDIIGVIEMPDSVSAAAFSMAVAAGGACRAVRTTPLLSVIGRPGSDEESRHVRLSSPSRRPPKRAAERYSSGDSQPISARCADRRHVRSSKSEAVPMPACYSS